MKKIFTLLAACTLSIGMATAVSPVKEKRYNFTAEQQAQVSTLAKEYMEKDGLGIKEAIKKATEEVGSKIVDLRVGYGQEHTLASSLRPDLVPWPANHAAWVQTATYPGSIEVDRDVTIHGYIPSELVRKVLLKSYSAADEARIQNVRFKGYNGVLNGGDAWMDNNTLSGGPVYSGVFYGNGNRGLAYFTKGTSDFSLEKGLLLTTSHSWGFEGPNENDDAFCAGVGYDGVTTNYGYSGPHTPSGDATTFDCDMRDTVILATASLGGLLEFDFQPAVGKASFDYIFGSEEYPEYVHSSYNDGFGFFVSGPYDDAATSATDGQNRISTYNGTSNVAGVTLPRRNTRGSVTIDGKKYSTYYQYNIASLPNGDPVGVDWTNWGWRPGSNDHTVWDTPYGANTTAPWDSVGVGALLAANPSWVNLHGSGSTLAFNPEYHTPIVTDSALMELDGITTKLTAVADSLIPGKWYHLKMIVCQTDEDHGDGVFLSNLDLGAGGVNYESSYMLNNRFHWLGAGFEESSARDENGNLLDITEYVNQSIIKEVKDAGGDITKYRGFVYSECPGTPTLKFTGVGNAILSTYNGVWDDYLTIDSLYISGVKVDSCYDQNGKSKDITEYTWGKDTIRREPTDVEGLLYFTLKDLPMSLNGKVSGISNLVYAGGPGSVGDGDTIYFVGYNQFTTSVKYSPVTESSSGSLSLGIKGGSEFIRWMSIDGIDCNPDDNSECRWRFLRDTITGKELPFSNWEILGLYDGYNPVPILVQEPNGCRIDTIWIGGSGPVTLQRYIEMPYAAGVSTVPNVGKHYAEGHKDFAFYAKFNGEPLTVKAIGYYSHDTITIPGAYQKDGIYEGSYKYIIKQVTEPWTVVFASGTTSGEETSNEAVAEQMVWTNGNTLYISSENAGTASIYTLAGALQKQVIVNGTVNVQLPRGFYVISLNGNQYKVMIK